MPNAGEKTNNKDEHSTNESINKGRMFQRHSFFANNKFTNANTSNASINPHEVLSKKDEEGSNIDIDEESKTGKKSSKKMMSNDDKYDIENASSEEIDELIEQYDNVNQNCEECECLKEDYGSILNECKGIEKWAILLSRNVQQLITNARHGECVRHIGKNEERMIKKEVRLLEEECQNHEKNFIRMHDDFAKLEDYCNDLEQDYDGIKVELEREKEREEKRRNFRCAPQRGRRCS